VPRSRTKKLLAASRERCMGRREIPKRKGRGHFKWETLEAQVGCAEGGGGGGYAKARARLKKVYYPDLQGVYSKIMKLLRWRQLKKKGFSERRDVRGRRF